MAVGMWIQFLCDFLLDSSSFEAVNMIQYNYVKSRLVFQHMLAVSRDAGVSTNATW